MKNWNQMFRGLLNLFMQSNCPLCQRSTPAHFCEYCQRQIQRCQLTNPEQFWQGNLPVFPWGIYTGKLKHALKALKYENQPQIAEILGYDLAAAWQKSSPLKGTKLTVVPIPLSSAKLRDRGFNQAELLAESFCQITRFPLKRQGLERVRHTEAQFSKTATDRQENLVGAFALGKEFRQRRPTSQVLLLDDIYTTGATAKSAAHTLHQHGIKVCGIVAIASSELSLSLLGRKLVN